MHGQPSHATGGGGQALVIRLELRGQLLPEDSVDRRGERFVDDSGSTALTYSGLVAPDSVTRSDRLSVPSSQYMIETPSVKLEVTVGAASRNHDWKFQVSPGITWLDGDVGMFRRSTSIQSCPSAPEFCT